jgi:hypothetical protein
MADLLKEKAKELREAEEVVCDDNGCSLAGPEDEDPCPDDGCALVFDEE